MLGLRSRITGPPKTHLSVVYNTPFGTGKNALAQMASKIQDVIIIGGGPAGLSTALGLARQLYSAVIFDSGTYRNERASHMHNVLTWDHRSPEDYRAVARRELLTRYETIHIENVAVNEVRRTETGNFEASDAAGKVWQARKLVLATGVKDIPPEIEGYPECWGRSM